MNGDVLYLNALNQLINIRSFYFAKILANFTAKEIWQSNYLDLTNKGINPKIAQKICQKDRVNPEKELEKLIQQQVIALTPADVKFPRLLKEITPPPPLLYVKGNADLLNRQAIAIVGTRKPTNYGLQAAKDLATGLSAAGLVIVSGLAFGIDSQAHLGTLENNGATIAVLGAGIDCFTPRSNHYLVKQILEKNGAIISEYPLGYQASKYTFPERNQIISGLSLGVIVVEAGLKSGALITARAALEQNREVFCVPGSVYSENSKGCNKFISQGAHLVTCADDVLEVLGINECSAQSAFCKRINACLPRAAKHCGQVCSLTKDEKILFDLLGQDPVSIDDLADKTGLAVEKIAAVLGQMVMEDVARETDDGGYVVN